MFKTLRIRPALILFVTLAGLAAPAGAQDGLAAALRLAAVPDWDGARAAAPAGVAQDLVEWHRLRAGDGTLTEYEAFVARHPDWPGLPLLREKAEVAVARSTSPDRVLAWFAAAPPSTGGGSVAFVRALLAQSRITEAESEGMRAWASLPFATKAEEEDMIALLPDAVPLVHEVRLDRLLWEARRSEAERMLPRVSKGWQTLARARIALQDDAEGVNRLIEAVPASHTKDAGLAYERFAWRQRMGLDDDALALLLDRSNSPATLGDPAAWADRRANLARALLRSGRPEQAYRAAASHQLTGGAAYADLEFLSGFIALRRLGDPDRALAHFRHLEAAVSTPISLARSLYWQGRAEEAAGRDDAARAAYARAAANQTAFYGLLASERLDLSLDPALLDTTPPPDWRQAGFADSSVLDAALLLVQAGSRTLAKRFFLHLSGGLNATELAQLADLALELDDPHIAVLIAKAAAERGIIIPRAYFPVPDFVPDGLAVSRALALSIARRESEFDPAARSTADARGLMQVLPGTAKQMARALGLPYTEARLLSDPAYNVRLGAEYLAKMAEEFGPSIALIASGYNAGPGRPRRWITEFGDPRRPDVDVVDWVETIPFTETRTYVMRVTEGVVIYRAKLNGAAGPVRISAELKG